MQEVDNLIKYIFSDSPPYAALSKMVEHCQHQLDNNPTLESNGRKLYQDILHLAQSDSALKAPQIKQILLAHPHSIEVAKLIARHPNCPKELLTTFSLFLESDIQENPIYTSLLKDKEWVNSCNEFRSDNYWPQFHLCNEGENSYIFEFVAEYWLQKGDETITAFMAADAGISKNIMTKLSHNESSYVRSELASNANLDEHTAMTLQNDRSSVVRKSLASNHATPLETLLALSHDKATSVRKAVHNNKSYTAVCTAV